VARPMSRDDVRINLTSTRDDPGEHIWKARKV